MTRRLASLLSHVRAGLRGGRAALTRARGSAPSSGVAASAGEIERGLRVAQRYLLNSASVRRRFLAVVQAAYEGKVSVVANGEAVGLDISALPEDELADALTALFAAARFAHDQHVRMQ
jgi:hypothetical protein